jgi:hypothetical protein
MAFMGANRIPHPIAVSDRSGTATMKNFGMNCGEWSLIDFAGTAHETLDKPVAVMPATDLPRGDILKIDAEGSELMILGSLKERVAEFSAIMVEVHSADWVGPIKIMLSRGGFTLVGERAIGPHRVELKWMKTELLEAKPAVVLASVPTADDAPLTGRPPARWGAGVRVPAKVKRRVLVAFPAASGMPSYIQNELRRLARFEHPDYDFDYVMVAGHGMISLGRNIIADVAMRDNHDILVQIDSDNLWNIEEHLLRILSHKEPIVGGLYARKQQGAVRWVGVTTPGAAQRDDGLIQADFLGTGFLRTDVLALVEMFEKLPERAFVCDEDDTGKLKEMTELFPCGVVGTNTAEGKIHRIEKMLSSGLPSEEIVPALRAIINDKNRNPGRLLGEDYYFSHLARKCGFQLWLDTKCIVPHVGNAPYPITADKISIPAAIPSHVLEMEGW